MYILNMWKPPSAKENGWPFNQLLNYETSKDLSLTFDCEKKSLDELPLLLH